MNRFIIFVYGTLSYLLCLATLMYTAGFIGNFGVPKSMDSPSKRPVASRAAQSALRLKTPWLYRIVRHQNRAAEQGLRRLKFQEGDACNLQGVDDNVFDLTLSIFAAMFDNPTFVSQPLKISASFMPPPPESFVSPMLRGVEDHVIERFGHAGVPKEKVSMEAYARSGAPR